MLVDVDIANKRKVRRGLEKESWIGGINGVSGPATLGELVDGCDFGIA